METAKAEARKANETDESDGDSESDEDGEVQKKFGVIIAKARTNYKKGCRRQKTKVGSRRVLLRSSTENTPTRG